MERLWLSHRLFADASVLVNYSNAIDNALATVGPGAPNGWSPRNLDDALASIFGNVDPLPEWPAFDAWRAMVIAEGKADTIVGSIADPELIHDYLLTAKADQLRELASPLGIRGRDKATLVQGLRAKLPPLELERAESRFAAAHEATVKANARRVWTRSLSLTLSCLVQTQKYRQTIAKAEIRTVRWVASGGANCCTACMKASGQVRPVGTTFECVDAFGPPAHVACTCGLTTADFDDLMQNFS